MATPAKTLVFNDKYTQIPVTGNIFPLNIDRKSFMPPDRLHRQAFRRGSDVTN